MTFFDFTTLLLLCLAVFFDLKIRRIPNWLVVCGAFSGLVISAFVSTGQLVQSFLGLIVGIFVLLAPFALGWIGAGDVKFFGVVGALFGVSKLPRIFFYSALVAGLIALAYLFFGQSRLIRFKELWTDTKIAILSLGQVLPTPVHQRTTARDNSVPWGVAFAVGTIIAYYIDDNGRWAGF